MSILISFCWNHPVLPYNCIIFSLLEMLGHLEIKEIVQQGRVLRLLCHVSGVKIEYLQRVPLFKIISTFNEKFQALIYAYTNQML